MRRPPSFVVLLLAGYVECIVLLLWDVVGGLVVPELPFMVSVVAFVGVAVFGLMILGWALVSPRSWKRWRLVIPALVLGFLVLWYAPGPLFRFGIERFVRRPDLNAFAAEVHRYGPITHMREDGDRPWTLNGNHVARTRAALDSIRKMWYGDDAMLLADVFARDGIDPAVYEDFRGKMHRFHFERLSRSGGYLLLARTRGSGLVYAPEGAPPLVVGGSIDGTRVKIKGRMGRWYQYGCCVQPAAEPNPDTSAAASGGEPE